MALPQYNTEQLIDNIKRRCSVPTSQLTFTNEDFSLLANDEMQTVVVPLMMSTREEYFVDFVDINVNEGRSLIIPEEAVGAKLRSVCYVKQTSPLVLINLPRIDLDVVAGIGFANYATLAGFYIQGNTLMLYPNTSVPVGTQIRLYYYKRTLVLAEPSSYGQVIAIDEDAKTLQLSFVPSQWEIGTELNAVSSKPNFEVTNSVMKIVTISAPSVIVDDITGIKVGDYVSDLGFSAIPQIPIEAHPYLAQLTAVKCLESLGDTNGMQAAQAKADQLKTALLIMVSQRVDGSIKKVINPSGGLRINGGLYRRGYGRW